MHYYGDTFGLEKDRQKKRALSINRQIQHSGNNIVSIEPSRTIRANISNTSEVGEGKRWVKK
jgi:hypothetical protein